MKLPLSWLRDWVEWPRDWSERELAQRLTFAGFEIEAVSAASPAFSGVVVAQIIHVERHPQADKLVLCRVISDPVDASADASAALQIVCGAANARAGLVTALAKVGASLPNDVLIRAAKLRGVESNGMLCSARDLGLTEAADGLLELPPDAPLGADLRAYLDLDEAIFEVNVTPNRGDAMSVLGIAREVAALSGAALKAPDTAAAAVVAVPPRSAPAPAAAGRKISVAVQPGGGAGRFLACVLHGLDNTRETPLWLRERLRRAGLRAISPVVDVTNYVMLELGQPMHAYDLARLQGGLAARRAHAQERLQLLDGREVQLDENVLVIADEHAAIGLAGVMGGARSAISRESRDIALEVAWFKPTAIAAASRRYALVTDASQRFERGVDWRGQERALERATQLIRQIAGGAAGTVVSAESARELPRTPSVPLRPKQLQRLLGVAVAVHEIEQRLRSLGMTVSSAVDGWRVQPPSWRFDIGIEADLIEEVARLGGFDAIGEREAAMPLVPQRVPSGEIDEQVVMQALAARGYQEVVNYAFVDPALQRQLLGSTQAIALTNPIAADLAVMRASLWPGLIHTARENLRRQQQRVRLFEIAHCFLTQALSAALPDTTAYDAGAAAQAAAGPIYREQKMLGGLALGTRLPEQWGSAAAAVDFYDVKGDVMSLVALTGGCTEISFEPATLACLHPGRSARVLRAGVAIGVMGELHPRLTRELELTSAPLLFELNFAGAFRAELAQFRDISRFPRIRRDISVTLPEGVSFASVRERVTVTASSLLKELLVFDIYQGAGVESGRKSLALGLILQDLSRTLTDQDADGVVRGVLDDLRTNLDARLRE